MAVGSSSTSTGEASASAHAIASRCRPPPDSTFGVVGTSVPEADELEGPLGAFEHLGGGHEAVLGSERHLVEERAGDHLRVGILEDHGDVLAELGHRAIPGVGARDPHRSLEAGGDRVRHEAVERERERRLAAAGWAEYEHDLAGADVERDAVGCRPRRIVVADAHGIQLEERGIGQGWPGSGLADDPRRGIRS